MLRGKVFERWFANQSDSASQVVQRIWCCRQCDFRHIGAPAWPLPTRFHSLDLAGVPLFRAPTEGCQSLLAPPLSGLGHGRFAAMRAVTREAHLRRRLSRAVPRMWRKGTFFPPTVFHVFTTKIAFSPDPLFFFHLSNYCSHKKPNLS